MRRNRVKMNLVILGLLFLGAGVLLFAFDSGLLLPEYKSVVFSWPMVFVTIGFVFMFSRDKWFAGIILMLIGGFFLLPQLHIGRLDFITQNYKALVFIIVGVIVIYRAIFGKHFIYRHPEGSWSEKKWNRKYYAYNYGTRENESGFIDRNCVFSGGKEKLNIKDFKGGDVNSVFGGIELDLSEAQLAEGTHRLELNSVFGGIVLFVPIDWKIEIHQTQVFGSFVDNRPKPGFEVDEKRTLIIEANSVFGGGEIRCK